MGSYLSTPKTEKETEFGTGKDVTYGMSGMQGWRRTMEDAHVASVKLGGNEDMAFFGVFDGHGGAEVAKFCAKHMAQEFLATEEFKNADYPGALKQVFHQIDRLLRDETYAGEIAQLMFGNKDGESEGEGEDSAMWERIKQLKQLVIEQEGEGSYIQAGCTAVVALKHGNTLFVANAGDSRGVLCRGGKAVALSEDHKPTQDTERARILAAGGYVSDMGGVARVNGNLNLSRAIGDLKYKTNKSLPPDQQIITAQPDVRVFELTKEDRFFILACDGVWDVMTNQEAVNFVAEGLDKKLDAQDVCSSLIDECLAADPKQAYGIGCDNMTCIVVQLHNFAAAN